jgi:hypothetical protein
MGIDDELCEDKKKHYLIRQLFIHADDKEMISVTDRAVTFDTVFPVMLDYQLRLMNYVEGDVELLWLEGLLKICTNFYQSGVMVPVFTFDFIKDQHCRQSIRCGIEHDQYGYPYLLIALYESNDSLRLH